VKASGSELKREDKITLEKGVYSKDSTMKEVLRNKGSREVDGEQVSVTDVGWGPIEVTDMNRISEESFGRHG